MYERFTDRARTVLQLANQEAQRFNHDYIGTEHILLGLVKEGCGVAANVLKNFDISPRTIHLEVEKIVRSGPDMVTLGKRPQTPRAKKAIEYSIEEARNLNHNYVGTEHLLLGLLREQEGVAAQVLTNLGLRLDTVRAEVLQLVGHDPNRSNRARIGGEPDSLQKVSKTPTLDRLSDDLTELARQGKLDPVVGRADEIRRLLCILHRRSRNSSILVGEVGVGKTALVEGLAQALADNSLPLPFSGWRLVRLDLSRMLAARRGRGDFEQRLEAVLTETREAGRVILFLDDLHLLDRTPNVLRQLALGRDRGQPWIATATPAGYQQLRAGVESLAAFFEPLLVRPLAREQALEALRQLQAWYASHHLLTIPDDALEAALDLTADPGSGVRLHRALSVLDEAAADVRLAVSSPPEIRALDARIEALNRQKEAAIAGQDFDLASRLRDQAERLVRQKDDLTRRWHEQTGPVPGVVDREAVTRVFGRMTPGRVEPDHISRAADSDPKPPPDSR